MWLTIYMASGKTDQNRLILVLSTALLVVITPFVVSFVVNNRQTTENFAAPLSSNSISLNPVPAPALGQTVTFAINYPANIANPRVEVACYTKEMLVYAETASVAEARSQGFLLGGVNSDWLNKYPTLDADCVANLFYFSDSKGVQNRMNLASTPTFHAKGEN